MQGARVSRQTTLPDMLSANSKWVTGEAWGPGVVCSFFSLSVVLRCRKSDTTTWSHLLSDRSSRSVIHRGQLERNLPPGWGGRDGGRASLVSFSQWRPSSCPVTMATQAARGGTNSPLGRIFLEGSRRRKRKWHVEAPVSKMPQILESSPQ